MEIFETIILWVIGLTYWLKDIIKNYFPLIFAAIALSYAGGIELGAFSIRETIWFPIICTIIAVIYIVYNFYIAIANENNTQKEEKDNTNERIAY